MRRDFQVQPIGLKEAKPFIEQWLYSKKCPTGRNIFFGAFLDGELYAVADYGAGANMDKGASVARITGLPVRYQDVTQEWLDAPHKNMNLDGLTVGPLNCVELKRLCRQGAKGAAQIPLTRFLSICHKALRREYGISYIVTYSDPGELRTVRSDEGAWEIMVPAVAPDAKQSSGHVYRAANFKHLGRTAAESHTVDEKTGEVVHRRVAYKELKRREKKEPDLKLADVRKKYGRVPIKTPPKERWFLAL